MSIRASIRRIEKIEDGMRAQGLQVLNLCGRDYRLKPLQEATEGHPRCYASVLGNCNGPISKEHYISENILKQLDTVNLDAFPGLKGRTTAVAPKDLAANCLCKYHNETLSPLDALAGEVFNNFSVLLNPAAPNILIWGPSLARWCLKALIGLVGSKQVYVNDKRVDPADLPKEWIEILFGLKDFPNGQGLYMTPVVGTQMGVGKRIQMETLLLEGQMKGVRLNIAGVEFLLSMVNPEAAFNPNHPAFGHILHQPRGLTIDQRPNRVAIFWE